MASRSDKIRKVRSLTSCAAIALMLSAGGALADEFPGDLWSVSYVKVSGANKDAVRRGLSDAANRVFYGDALETHLRADARDDGSFDLSIIGPDGKELARRSGLSYDANGNVAKSVSEAALNWLGGLSCGAGCQVAESAPTPAPAPAPAEAATQVAAAAVKAIEESSTQAAKPAVEEPKPEPVKVAEQPIVIAAVPTAEAPKVPAAQKAVAAPKKTTAAKKPQGIDADVFLAKPKAASAPKSGTSRAAKPVAKAPVKTPKVPVARTVVKPAVAAAPKSDTSSGAAKAQEAPKQAAPTVAKKPEPAKAPEVEIATPAADTSTTTEVAKAVEAATPKVAEVPAKPVEEPKPSIVVEDTPEAPETPETDASVAVIQTETPVVQEVSPAVSIPAPRETETPTVSEIAESAAAATAAAATTAATAATGTDAEGDGEQLALVNPQQEVTPAPAAAVEPTEPLQPAPAVETPADIAKPVEETETKVETKIAALDPNAEGPTLANARWVGFTPAVFTGSDNKAGAWIAGPFDRKQRTGWITDTATGATTRVTFIWREGGSGSRTATLSRDAAAALGLGRAMSRTWRCTCRGNF